MGVFSGNIHEHEKSMLTALSLTLTLRCLRLRSRLVDLSNMLILLCTGRQWQGYWTQKKPSSQLEI